MSTDGMILSMIGGYSGDHEYTHCVTEPEDRPRWFLSDVPDFVRIDHPNRKPFRANGGVKKHRQASEPRQPVTQEKKIGRPKAEPLPVMAWYDGVVRKFSSPTEASENLGFLLRHADMTILRTRGKLRKPRVGVVMWLQGQAMPEGIKVVKSKVASLPRNSSEGGIHAEKVL